MYVSNSIGNPLCYVWCWLHAHRDYFVKIDIPIYDISNQWVVPWVQGDLPKVSAEVNLEYVAAFP